MTANTFLRRVFARLIIAVSSGAMEGQQYALVDVSSKPNAPVEAQSSGRAGGGSGAHSIRIFLIDLKSFNLSSSTIFIVLVFAVVTFYSLYAILQEKLTRSMTASHSLLGWFLTLASFVVIVLLSFIERSLVKAPRRLAPFRSYLRIGFLQSMTYGLTNSSAFYLSYPTVALFKSSKLLPVMCVNVLWRKKKQSLLDQLAACVMVSGLLLFSRADHAVGVQVSAVGLSLLLASLFVDAFIGNIQEQVIEEYQIPMSEMTLWSHGVGTVVLLAICIVTGELVPGITWLGANVEQLFWVFLFGCCGFCGVTAVFLLIQEQGVVIAVTVTSARKACTVLFSYILFPKPVSAVHLLASLLFFLGVWLNIISKNPKLMQASVSLLKRFMLREPAFLRAEHEAHSDAA
jgi:solute carrier family 35 (adenosine 3'-phospho 5'-phosphosulfate transporter), member B3